MMGNLGNQMFIYAMARSLQLEYKQKLTIDKGGLKRMYYTADYKLDNFNIPKDINYNLEKITKISKWKYKITSFLFHLQYGIIRRLRSNRTVPSCITKFWYKLSCYYNVNRQYYDYPKHNACNKYVYGYFQSEKYFYKYKDIIKKDFEVIVPFDENSKQIMEQIASSNSVAVSIRASKNPENPKVNDNINLGLIDKDYYYNGMKEIASRISNPKFFIFADDIEIVKKEYEFPYPVTYVHPKDSVDGMRLMYNCNHFVISNSTFSWWGAYLSSNKEKIVIMPERWDRHGPSREDIYFGNPIRLSVNFLTK